MTLTIAWKAKRSLMVKEKQPTTRASTPAGEKGLCQAFKVPMRE
jgi:hypothetical protein